jgi:hypothetical protein
MISGLFGFSQKKCKNRFAFALKDSGHFAYRESPDDVRQELGDFFAHSTPQVLIS